jgi:heat shock protein HslJ
MKRTVALLLLMLAGCDSGQDRLSDEQATRDPAPDTQAVPAGQGTDDSAGPTGEVPAEPGEVVYKALGNEPGWALTVRQNAMLYQGDYGTVWIVEATPGEFSPGPGTTRSGRLTITIARGPCSDGMSDKVWRDKVTVAVAGGRTAQGCGGGEVVDVNAIEDVSWTVSAINDRPTGGGSRYALTFANGEVRGSLGCNSIGGKFSRNGDHLFTSELTATEMACGPPADKFERDGLAVLGSNMRIEKVDARTRLVSEAGTIDLAAREQEKP